VTRYLYAVTIAQTFSNQRPNVGFGSFRYMRPLYMPADRTDMEVGFNSESHVSMDSAVQWKWCDARGYGHRKRPAAKLVGWEVK
jgi:hypothetical protein